MSYIALQQCKPHMDYVSKKSSTDRVYYIYLESPRPDDTDGFVLLYSHGNAEHLGTSFSSLKWLRSSLKMAVVGYDYCGYGFSGFPDPSVYTPPTEKAVYGDADAMYECVTQKLGFAANRVILFGRSVGGGPTCYLAEKHHNEIAGVILQSTFTSCLNVVSECCLPKLFAFWDMFKNVKRMEKITGCPILFIHGVVDNVVPMRCSEKLLEVAEAHRRKKMEAVVKKRRKQIKDVHPSDTEQSHPLSQRTFSTSEVDTSRGNEDDVRNYAGGAEMAQTDLEKMGIFYKWFPGCSHNDMEKNERKLFITTILHFLSFCEKTRPL